MVGNKCEQISKTLFVPGTVVTHHHQECRKSINANNNQTLSLSFHLLFVFGGGKAGAQKGNDVVDEKAYKNSGGDNLHVRTLLLVEVPCTTHPQEIPSEPYSIEDDDDHVQYLYKFKFQKLHFFRNDEVYFHKTLV